MKGPLRSELLKLRTTRTTRLLVAWMLGLVLLVVLLHAFSLNAETLASREGQLKVLGWGTGVGTVFASLLGALSITAEIRHGTIRPTFLATPRRQLVIAAKVLASATAGVAFGLLAVAVAAALESGGMAMRGIGIEIRASDYVQALAGGAASAALFAALGVGVGALLRNQVGAVVGLCVWLLLVETTLIGNVPAAGKFAPEASAGALAGAIQTQSASKLLAPALGALLLVLYAGIAALAGAIATTRRDVA